MYFVRYNPLKEKLRERALSDREALPYLILFVALTALAVGLPLYESYNLLDGISAFSSVIIAVVGLIYAYKQNEKEDGYDLIQKYVVLGWITGVRFILIGLPLYVVVGVIAYSFGFSMEETNPIDLAYWVGFEALLYYRIGQHIRDTTGANKSVVSTPEAALLP